MTTPSIPETSRRPLYLEEIKALVGAPFDQLPAVPTRRDLRTASTHEAILRILWDTWARADEVAHILIEDLDMKRRMLTLRHTKRKVINRGQDSVMEPRQVDLWPSTIKAIHQHLDRRPKQWKTGPLFCSGHSHRPITSRSVRKIVHRYAVALGIQRQTATRKGGQPIYLITPKSIREAGEAYFIMATRDPKAAARRAGHSLRTQSEYYDLYDPIRTMLIRQDGITPQELDL